MARKRGSSGRFETTPPTSKKAKNNTGPLNGDSSTAVMSTGSRVRSRRTNEDLSNANLSVDLDLTLDSDEDPDLQDDLHSSTKFRNKTVQVIEASLLSSKLRETMHSRQERSQVQQDLANSVQTDVAKAVEDGDIPTLFLAISEAIQNSRLVRHIVSHQDTEESHEGGTPLIVTHLAQQLMHPVAEHVREQYRKMLQNLEKTTAELHDAQIQNAIERDTHRSAQETLVRANEIVSSLDEHLDTLRNGLTLPLTLSAAQTPGIEAEFATLLADATITSLLQPLRDFITGFQHRMSEFHAEPTIGNDEGEPEAGGAQPRVAGGL